MHDSGHNYTTLGHWYNDKVLPLSMFEYVTAPPYSAQLFGSINRKKLDEISAVRNCKGLPSVISIY